MVLIHFVKVFRNYLHEHETHEGFRWNLTDCEVGFNLVDLVLDCQVCSTFIPLYLALHVAASSTFGCSQRLTVDEEIFYSLGINGLVTLFLLRVRICVGIWWVLTRTCCT